MNIMPYGSKYKTAQELWAAILKTFSGNEATKKMKKNLLKQQYGNFKAEGSETLEQTFNRLQVIVSQLQFMDVEIEQDDLNQKFLTSLALEWLMHTIVWRNRSDLDTMSVDDLYNYLKVYESEVQKKSEPNSQNMAFISLAKHSSGNKEVNIASGSTASINVPLLDINQIDEDDIEEMDIKWNMTFLSLRADRFCKKTWKKISIQGTDMAGFDKLKVECFNCHKMGHFARECRAPRSQDRGKRDNYRQGSKVKEHAPKALMAINEVGWDWSYMANDDENHALVADEEAPLEFALMAKTSAESEVFDNSLCSKTCKKNSDSLNSKITELNDKLCDAKNMIYHYKLKLAQVEARLAEHRNQELKYYEKIRILEFKTESRANCIESLTKELELIKKEKKGLETKLTGFQTASKDLDSLLESQRLDKNKEGLGYSDVPSLPAHVYSPPKKDMSWTGLPEFKDDTVTDYSKPAPTVESSLDDAQNRNPFVTTTEASPSTITPKPFIKFVKATDRSIEIKTSKHETAKPAVKYAAMYNKQSKSSNGSSQNNIDDKGYWDSGCSRHMTGNISYLSDYEPFDGGYVSFGQGGCKITGKGTIKTSKLEFENVYFVKDLKYNLFSVSQICDNKNSVLFTDSKCIVLGRDFKLLDDANVLLRTPRQHNMYSIDLNNIIPHKDLTCLVAKASANEGMLWHRRLVHLNFKTMNRLVRHNLVRGLPSKCFENDHTCTTCLKGKQHKASCKSKLVNSITKPLHTLHMDLFGPTSVSSISHKWKFITEIENLKDLKVKIIKCDNRGEFRNKEMNDFCSQKGIKREFSNARTPQQNGVTERRNKTLIEVSRTMVLVNKSYNKTPYELFNGRTPAIGFLKPFGCHIMILNTLDNLRKFEAKGDEGTNPTNLLSIKDAASQEVKKDVSSLRYIALPNWVHDALLESSSSKPQDDCSTDVPESSRNSNPTATLTNPSADQIETLTVETPIPTVSSPVPTACFTNSQEPSSDTRLISKRVANQVETPSLDNILTLTNRFEDILGVKTNSDESNGVEADEDKIDYDEVFAPVARIEAIRLFLAYASLMDFIVYQMDVKSAFLYGTIDEEVHQVTPKECHLHTVKRIFRYLKGHPKLGLYYPKECPFDLIAYSDSDYGGATQDRKSTTGGCQFLGRRIISCQCKKQTIVSTSTTEAKYVTAISCCGQVLWIQNQLLDYGLSMPCEALSREISSSILYLLCNNESKLKNQMEFLTFEALWYALTFKPTVYISHIRQFWSTARIETIEEGTKILATIDGRIVPLFDSMLVPQDEGSGTPTEPHPTPSPEVQQTSPTTHSSLTLPPVTTAPIPTVISSDTPHLKQYTRRARIAQSLALPPVADEHASPLRDVSQGEACPTISSLDAKQDMENIAKTSTLPHESTSRVPSLAADEGKRSGDDAPIKGRSLDEGEEVAEKGSNDTEEMINVLTSMDAATVLSSGVAKVATGCGSIPTAGPHAAGVPTGSDVVPIAGLIFATTTVMARQLEEEMEIEAQRMNDARYFEKRLPLESLRHHQVDEKKIRDGRRWRRKLNDPPFYVDIFTDFAFLNDSKRTHDSIDNVLLTIVEIGVPLHDLSKQASKKHTIRTRLEVSSTLPPLMTRLGSVRSN
nr:hypothetical protein [Tanacetum cinerariifolium]